jgi:hypothetical protein
MFGNETDAFYQACRYDPAVPKEYVTVIDRVAFKGSEDTPSRIAVLMDGVGPVAPTRGAKVLSRFKPIAFPRITGEFSGHILHLNPDDTVGVAFDDTGGEVTRAMTKGWPGLEDNFETFQHFRMMSRLEKLIKIAIGALLLLTVVNVAQGCFAPLPGQSDVLFNPDTSQESNTLLWKERQTEHPFLVLMRLPVLALLAGFLLVIR